MTTLTLCDWAATVHEIAREKGFYDTLDMETFESQAKQLAMMHSEVTEVLEALRKDKGQDQVVEEIADIIIRTVDFYAALLNAGVVTDDLDDVMERKTATNTNRPRMHGVKG